MRAIQLFLESSSYQLHADLLSRLLSKGQHIVSNELLSPPRDRAIPWEYRRDIRGAGLSSVERQTQGQLLDT